MPSMLIASDNIKERRLTRIDDINEIESIIPVEYCGSVQILHGGIYDIEDGCTGLSYDEIVDLDTLYSIWNDIKEISLDINSKICKLSSDIDSGLIDEEDAYKECNIDKYITWRSLLWFKQCIEGATSIGNILKWLVFVNNSRGVEEPMWIDEVDCVLDMYHWMIDKRLDNDKSLTEKFEVLYNFRQKIEDLSLDETDALAMHLPNYIRNVNKNDLNRTNSDLKITLTPKSKNRDIFIQEDYCNMDMSPSTRRTGDVKINMDLYIIPLDYLPVIQIKKTLHKYFKEVVDIYLKTKEEFNSNNPIDLSEEEKTSLLELIMSPSEDIYPIDIDIGVSKDTDIDIGVSKDTDIDIGVSKDTDIELPCGQ